MRWLVLCAVIALGGCSNTLAAISNGPQRSLPDALLAAYVRPSDDLSGATAAAFCADFTPSVAAHLATAVHGSSCESGVRHLLGSTGSTTGTDLGHDRMLLRRLRMVDVTRREDRAVATLAIFGHRTGKRSHFRLIAGRWRVADTPSISYTTGCSPPSTGCTGAGLSLSTDRTTNWICFRFVATPTRKRRRVGVAVCTGPTRSDHERLTAAGRLVMGS